MSEATAESPAQTDGWPRRAAVVGSGTMGTGFVQLLALAGIPCAIADASPALAAAARDRAIALAERFERQGLMPARSHERIADAVTAADSVAAAADGAQVVIEAVPEEPALKHGVLAQVESAIDPAGVLATNTSAIPIAQLGAPLARPERFLGMHWFNPPQWVPAVEVIPGAATAPDAVALTVALLRRLGKQPTVVGDAAGFVANRIQFAMFKEAAAVVADGIATPEQVDAVVRSSFGFRLPFFGPFEIADMAGLDVYAGAYAALEEAFGERFAAPAALTERVAEGRLGTKAGGGFLQIPAEQVEALTTRRDASYAGLERLRRELAGDERAGGGE